MVDTLGAIRSEIQSIFVQLARLYEPGGTLPLEPEVAEAPRWTDAAFHILKKSGRWMTAKTLHNRLDNGGYDHVDRNQVSTWLSRQQKKGSVKNRTKVFESGRKASQWRIVKDDQSTTPNKDE